MSALTAEATALQPKTGVRGWVVLAMLFAFYIINFADKSVLGLAAEPIMRELEITPTQYGLISSAFFFVFSFSALLVGFLVDKYRTKPILTIMALVWTVAQALMLAPVAGIVALVASRMVLGLGEGPAFGVTNHAAMKWFPHEKRTLAATGVGLGIPIGTLISIPILMWVINDYSWRTAFASLAFVSLVWAIVWAILGKEGPFDEKKHAVSGSASITRAPVKSYLRIMVCPSYLGVLLAGIASYWSVTILLTWVPAFLSSTQGYSATETASVTMSAWFVQAFAIFFVVGLASTIMTKRGIDTRWSRGVLSGSMVLISGAAMVGFYFVPQGPLSIVLMALAFGLSACSIPMSQPVIGELAPAHLRGGLLGAYTAIYSLTGVFAPALTGLLVDLADTPEAGFGIAFLVAAVLLIIAGIACMLMTNPQKDARKLAAIIA